MIFIIIIDLNTNILLCYTLLSLYVIIFSRKNDQFYTMRQNITYLKMKINPKVHENNLIKELDEMKKKSYDSPSTSYSKIYDSDEDDFELIHNAKVIGLISFRFRQKVVQKMVWI